MRDHRRRGGRRGGESGRRRRHHRPSPAPRRPAGGSFRGQPETAGLRLPLQGPLRGRCRLQDRPGDHSPGEAVARRGVAREGRRARHDQRHRAPSRGKPRDRRRRPRGARRSPGAGASGAPRGSRPVREIPPGRRRRFPRRAAPERGGTARHGGPRSGGLRGEGSGDRGRHREGAHDPERRAPAARTKGRRRGPISNPGSGRPGRPVDPDRIGSLLAARSPRNRGGPPRARVSSPGLPVRGRWRERGRVRAERAGRVDPRDPVRDPRTLCGVRGTRAGLRGDGSRRRIRGVRRCGPRDLPPEGSGGEPVRGPLPRRRALVRAGRRRVFRRAREVRAVRRGESPAPVSRAPRREPSGAAPGRRTRLPGHPRLRGEKRSARSPGISRSAGSASPRRRWTSPFTSSETSGTATSSWRSSTCGCPRRESDARPGGDPRGGGGPRGRPDLLVSTRAPGVSPARARGRRARGAGRGGPPHDGSLGVRLRADVRGKTEIPGACRPHGRIRPGRGPALDVVRPGIGLPDALRRRRGAFQGPFGSSGLRPADEGDAPEGQRRDDGELGHGAPDGERRLRSRPRYAPRSGTG